MLKQIYEINELGYLKEIKVAEFDSQGNCLEILVDNIITVDIPNGLYRAKWTGTEWIEGLTQEEIDALNNVPTKPTESEQRLLDLELAIAEILGGGL